MAGFTVLEIMLAIGIFSLAMVALAVALNRTIDSARAVQRENEVRAGLQSLLAEARQAPLKPGKELLKGAARGVAYEKEVDRIALKNDKGLDLVFHRLTVRARWKTAGEPEQREAEVLIYQP